MPDVNLTIRAQNLAAQQFAALQRDLQASNQHLAQIAENTQRVTRTRPQLTDYQRTVRQLTSEYRSLRTSVGNVAAVTSQFATSFNRQLQGTIDAAVQFERLRRSLDTISGSAAEANAQYERLIEVSRLPGLNLEQALRASVQLQAIGTEGERAAEVITQFGNALALGGGSARDLNQIVNSIRQMSAEGRILQEDLSIMTTRVAVLVPILEQAFGGVRAEDIRASGTSAEEFIQIVVAALAELPRAGETAANAIENLSDTTQRAQAAIGTQLLPAVRDFTATAEGLVSSLEQAPPALQRTIAVAGVLGTTFLTVTAGAAGLTAALPALGAALTFLATNPIGIAITAIAAITAGIIAWRVATAEVATAQDQLAAAIQAQNFDETFGSRERLIQQLRTEREVLNELVEAQETATGGAAFGRARAQRGQQIEQARGRVAATEESIRQADAAIVAGLAASETADTARGVVTRPQGTEEVAEEITRVVETFNTELGETVVVLQNASGGAATYNTEVLAALNSTELLTTSLGQVAVAVPEIADSASMLAIDFQAGTRALADLQAEIQPLASPAGLPSLVSPLRDLGALVSGFQQGAIGTTGAADIGLPVIGAEADPNRDRFVGAFNVSALVGDVEEAFDGYGRQFGEAVVAGLIEQRGTIEQLFTDFVSASFQDLAVILGGNVGDQIAGALSGRLSEVFAPLIGALGIGGAGAAGLAGAAFGLGPLIQSLVSTQTGFTQEQIQAQITGGGFGGLGGGAGLGAFAAAGAANTLAVTVINSEELARRFGITLGESGLLGEEGRDFAQEQADLIAAAIAEGARQDTAGLTDAIVTAFTDAGVIEQTFNQNPVVLQAFDEIEAIQAQQVAAVDRVLGIQQAGGAGLGITTPMIPQRLAPQDISLLSQELSQTLRNDTLRVEVVNKPDVAIPDVVRMAADSPLPVTLDEVVMTEGTVTGTVNIGGTPIPVTIQNTEAFARAQNQDDALFQRLGNSA